MLHLVLGFLTIARSDEPALLYVGKDADAAVTAARRAVEGKTHRVADRFIVSSPVTMYADVEADITAVIVTPANAVNAVDLIPVEIGEGEGKKIIHVSSAEDADFLRMMGARMMGARIAFIAASAAGDELARSSKEAVEKLTAELAVQEERVAQLETALNAEARKAAKTLRAKATQLNQAAVDARLAADAAKGKATHKKLEEAAEAALDAAKQAEADADEAEAALK